MGITGWSYGGFMTMFAVTQTTRFRAAVAGAGVSNWQSYYGENSIDKWMIPVLRRQRVRRPRRLRQVLAHQLHQAREDPDADGRRRSRRRVPRAAKLRVLARARDEGVKTQLVVYPNEGHHFVSPDHQRDVLKRALDWFETEMPPNYAA